MINNNLHFRGVYAVVAKSEGKTGGNYYNLDDVKKALTQKAATDKVRLSTDADDQGKHVLMFVKDKLEVPPVATLSSPFFDDKVYVFTQEDAKAFDGYKNDVQQYWETPKKFVQKASERFDKSYRKMTEVAAKIERKSKWAASAFTTVSVLGFTGVAEVLSRVERYQHRKAASKITAKWANLLDKLPKADKLLPKEDVLKAITENKFNVETGEITK